MWTPRSYRVEELTELHAFIRAHPFALLVSGGGDGITGTHVPFMLEDDGQNGTLVAHMARANPHWKSWTPQTEVMVAFTGPHAYVSPAWYQQRVTVPTWNYAAVHAYGRPVLVQEGPELRDMVTRLTRQYENGESGWSLDEAEPIMERELLAIVGFRIPIDRLEGKFKFNQNRSRADQEGVVAGLEASMHPADRDAARFMKDRLAASDGE